VLLRIHRGGDTLERAAQVHAWIYRIARNAIVDLSWLPSLSATATGVRSRSCYSLVVVMHTTQDRDGHDGHRRGYRPRRLPYGGDGLR